MSLFRVRDLWSFDLADLEEPAVESSAAPEEDADGRQEKGAEEKELDQEEGAADGKYVFCVGSFESIGSYHVLVCASLAGFLYLLQVPEENQARQEWVKQEKRAPPAAPLAGRQLLAAKHLAFPVIDLQCGNFASALKQSVAVLGFDKLIIYKVKQQQLDLMSYNIAEESVQQQSPLNTNKLSHEFEECYRISLHVEAMASVLIACPSSNQARAATAAAAVSKGDSLGGSHNAPRGQHSDRSSGAAKSKSRRASAAEVYLPQRGSLIVGYSNQFLFTLISHKKIIAHYSLLAPSLLRLSGRTMDSDEAQRRLQQLACFAGSPPMAVMRNYSRSPALAVALSNSRCYLLELAKLEAMADRHMMKRVAQSLLGQQPSTAAGGDNEQKSEPSAASRRWESQSQSQINSDSVIKGEQAGSVVQVNLEELAEWQIELLAAPLRLQAVPLATEALGDTWKLIVMSRYLIDVFSQAGQHLWSQRFESPLICLHSYPQELSNQAAGAKMLTLVCTDSISLDNCNLLVLEEETTVWSALLDAKPSKICRANLSRTEAALVSMTGVGSRISASYLGTNQEKLNEYASGEHSAENDGAFVKLRTLDETFMGAPDERNKSRPPEPCCNRLQVHVRLEASQQWPDVQVESSVDIKPDSEDSHGVLQAMSVTLEFDDLLCFKPEARFSDKSSELNEGTVQIQLGSFWPDGREPIGFRGSFSLKPSVSVQASSCASILPKSLQVNLYIRFHDSDLGQFVQEESFLLPVNLVGKLVYIEHSTCTASQQANKPTMQPVEPEIAKHSPRSLGAGPKACADNYLCDMIMSGNGCTFSELVDDVIESDLVCRGFNIESSDTSKRGKNPAQVIENTKLLEQSLDCRLKYRALDRSTSGLRRQESEELSQIELVSIAFKLLNIDPKSEAELYATVWLHLCDLNKERGSKEIAEMVQLHCKQWKVIEKGSVEEQEEEEEDDDDVEWSKDKSEPISVLVSIECDYPLPALYFQAHFQARFANRFQAAFGPLTRSVLRRLQSNDLNKRGNLMILSLNLHDYLALWLQDYRESVEQQLDELKRELNSVYYKFYLTTVSLLAQCKKLASLPEESKAGFKRLAAVNKEYQLKLVGLLGRLKRVKQLDYRYSKVPDCQAIMIEEKAPSGQPKSSAAQASVSTSATALSFPQFKQLIN